MAQKLIMGINNSKLNASWKTNAYATRFKMIHYGIDLVSSKGQTVVFGNGNGKVISSGCDSIFGNFVVILYKDCYNHATKTISDLVVRMWHMAKVYVKAGATIRKDTQLGHYGNTGTYTTGAHLHMEVSTDTTYPMRTMTLSGKSSHFEGVKQGATDKDMSNPLSWMHLKVDAPDMQTWTTANDAYIRPEDKSLPTVTTGSIEITVTTKPKVCPTCGKPI